MPWLSGNALRTVGTKRSSSCSKSGRKRCRNRDIDFRDRRFCFFENDGGRASWVFTARLLGKLRGRARRDCRTDTLGECLRLKHYTQSLLAPTAESNGNFIFGIAICTKEHS